MIMATLAVPFLIDAMYGLYILRMFFTCNIDISTSLISQKDSSEIEEIPYNVRVPRALLQIDGSNKLFMNGWKHDLLNIDGQVSK